jgi:hypothetical protein
MKSYQGPVIDVSIGNKQPSKYGVHYITWFILKRHMLPITDKLHHPRPNLKKIQV